MILMIWKYRVILGGLIAILITVACAGFTISTPAAPNIVSASPTPRTLEPLVGREPRLWVSAPEKIIGNSSLPFLGIYSKTNEDYLSGYDDREKKLALYNQQGRIVTMDYLWGTTQCDFTDSIDIKFVLYQSSQGAHESFLYNKSIDENDPTINGITEQNAGDEAYSVTGASDTCGSKLYYSFIYIRRYNVAAMLYFDTYSTGDGQYGTQEFFDKWGNTLDRWIIAEATSNPGAPESLATLNASITSYVFENTPTGSENNSSSGAPSEPWDKDGDGIMSYEECIYYSADTVEECNIMFGVGGNDPPPQEP